MTDLTLTRTFTAPPEKLFEFLTKTENLVKWFGPEGCGLAEHALNFERTGPWMATLKGLDSGDRFKMSGQVTHVDPPSSIGFTWAWHDENDRRGVESHVTIRLVPAQDGGTALSLTHADLPDAETAENHEKGWASTLHKLTREFDIWITK